MATATATATATAGEGSSKVGGRGVGKIQNRRPQTTAYDGPPNAVRNPRNGWLSKVVDPASRLSKRLFSFAFGKRLSEPELELPPPPEVNEDPRDETVIPLLKRRRDSDIGSDGPIRRIRQKPALQTSVHEDYVAPVAPVSSITVQHNLPDLNEEPCVSASTSTARGQLVGYHPSNQSLSNSFTFNSPATASVGSTDSHDQAVTSPLPLAANMFDLASTSTEQGQLLGATTSNQSDSNSFTSVGNASTPATGSTASHSSSGSVSVAAPTSVSAPSSRMLCGSYNYTLSSSGNFSFGFL